MAAAFIPLIAGIAPSIITLIASLVHKSAPAAESTNGSGTGPVKFAQVFQTVITSLQQAVAAGQIPQTLPPDDSIKLIIQSVVTSMKGLGLLDTSTADTLSKIASGAPGASSSPATVSGNSLTFVLNHLTELESKMSALDDKIASFTQEVSNNTSVVKSAEALIQAIPGMIQTAVDAAQAAGATPAQLQAFTDLQTTLAANDTSLAAAVVAGAPSAPAPPAG